MQITQTGAIVMTNGRIVSLAELETRSNARKTATVPYSRTAKPMPIGTSVFQPMALNVTRGWGGSATKSGASGVPYVWSNQPCIVWASIMSPLIFSLPDMKAWTPLSLPLMSRRKSGADVIRVTVASFSAPAAVLH